MTDGTAQRPHMSCSYSDIAIASYDNKALNYHRKPETWKRFRDDVFVVWTHSAASLPCFLEYLNGIDNIGKIRFTMQIADAEKCLEFLYLKLKCFSGKISVDVFAKPTNSFIHVVPSTCDPKETSIIYHKALHYAFVGYVIAMKNIKHEQLNTKIT